MAVLKTDSTGRVRTPVEHRDALLDAFEHSGMSGAAFAKLHGIKYPTFAYWRQQRKRRSQPERPSDAPMFEEVELGPGTESGLKIELPGGAVLRIDRADQFPGAVALLKYLEHAC
jgi:transposase-like protein